MSSKQSCTDKQARNIVKNLIAVCYDEKKQGCLALPLCQSLDRVYNYTALSKRTIQRIKQEAKIAGNVPLKSPSKKGKLLNKNRKINMENIDREVIRRTIEEFYLIKKIVPTCAKLHEVLKEKIAFPWGVRSLERVLKNIGYIWRRCNSNKKILIEKPDIVFLRNEYLRKIRKFRAENRQIYYIDVTWVDSNLAFKNCWHMTDNNGLLTHTSSTNCIIVAQAGSNHGFLSEVTSLYMAEVSSADHHEQMIIFDFEKWVTDKLIPILQPNSVIVIDNAPYYNVEDDIVPSKNSLKKTMIAWLEKNNIPFTENMRKAELYNLISLNKPVKKKYHINEIMKVHHHTVLRLPQYMSELNPIKLAGNKIKNIVQKHNVTEEMSVKNLGDLILNAISKVTSDDWENYMRHVLSAEEENWLRDGIIENTIDDLILQFGGEYVEKCESSDSSVSSCLNSDSQ